MILNKLYSSNSKYSFFLLLAILFCFIFSLSSCSTTETYTIKEPQTIEHDGEINIQKVIMKDSTVYDFKENEAAYRKKYKDTTEVVVYSAYDTVKDSISNKVSRLNYLLLLKDMYSIKYTRTYMSTSDMLITAGITIVSVAAVLYFILALTIFSQGGFDPGG
jgi:hypothetical protein